jgi:hypothetical protein
MCIVGLCVNVQEEGALDAPRALNRRPVVGTGRIDDAITVWGTDTNRPAFASLERHSPQDKSDMPAALEATITSLGGENAPAEPAQHA